MVPWAVQRYAKVIMQWVNSFRIYGHIWLCIMDSAAYLTAFCGNKKFENVAIFVMEILQYLSWIAPHIWQLFEGIKKLKFRNFNMDSATYLVG